MFSVGATRLRWLHGAVVCALGTTRAIERRLVQGNLQQFSGVEISAGDKRENMVGKRAIIKVILFASCVFNSFFFVLARNYVVQLCREENCVLQITT